MQSQNSEGRGRRIRMFKVILSYTGEMAGGWGGEDYFRDPKFDT